MWHVQVTKEPLKGMTTLPLPKHNSYSRIGGALASGVFKLEGERNHLDNHLLDNVFYLTSDSTVRISLITWDSNYLTPLNKHRSKKRWVFTVTTQTWHFTELASDSIVSLDLLSSDTVKDPWSVSPLWPLCFESTLDTLSHWPQVDCKKVKEQYIDKTFSTVKPYIHQKIPLHFEEL